MGSPAHERIDDYLVRCDVEYDALGDGMWVIHDDLEQVDNVVISCNPPLVVFRVKVMEIPSDLETQRELYQKLLTLNATDLVSGAYGLEGSSVIMTETLQAENLDFNEFQVAIEGTIMALREHYDVLKAFHHPSDA